MKTRHIGNPCGLPIEITVQYNGRGNNRLAWVGVFTFTAVGPWWLEAKPGETVYGLIRHAAKTGEAFALLDWLEENHKDAVEWLPVMRAGGVLPKMMNSLCETCHKRVFHRSNAPAVCHACRLVARQISR